VFGISVAIDWSLAFIAVLMTWNLASVFAHWHPAWGPAADLLVALAAVALFFASILAHELAHSLVARARGIPVRSITLWMFGGVSNFEREPTSPGIELQSAVVGPLTSLALGVLFLALGGHAARAALAVHGETRAALAALSPAATLLLWLGPVNLMVGLFNLVPAFPLDGGRIVRALVWRATGELSRATRVAATIGQGVGWALIVAGVAMAFGLRVPLLGTGAANGLWLAFIGWFLHGAAANSYRQLLVQEALEGVPVARLMQAGATSVPDDLPVERLVTEWILGSNEHAFPVERPGGALAGIVCLHDVRKLVKSAWATTTVADVMTPTRDLVVAAPEDDAAEALQRMARRDVGQLPVLSDGHLVGMLRARDVARVLDRI
jgi:Zn-dependent protease/CBS domain-containing protein